MEDVSLTNSRLRLLSSESISITLSLSLLWKSYGFKWAVCTWLIYVASGTPVPTLGLAASTNCAPLLSRPPCIAYGIALEIYLLTRFPDYF